MTQLSASATPSPAAPRPPPPAPPIPRWLTAIVIAGALLTAAGAVIALLPSAGHPMNAAGHDYAYYFVTRNLARAVMLLAALALQARRPLAGLMLLTALIQLLDAVTATATGRAGLVPIDLAFTAIFLIAAARLTGPFWKPASWRQAP